MNNGHIHLSDSNESTTLFELEGMVSLLLNNTDDAFVIIDKDLVVTLFNKQAQALYYEYLGIIIKTGSLIENYINADRREFVRKKYEKALTGTMVQWEATLTFTDESKRDFLFKLNPLRDVNNEIVGLFTLAKEITEQRRSERKLKINEQRFQSLVEHGDDGIIILNSSGKPLYSSPGNLRILGYTDDEIMNLTAIDIVYPEDVNYVKAKQEECLVNPLMPVKNITYRVKHKNGYWLWLESTFTNFVNDPVINGIINNFHDVTEKRYYVELDKLEKCVLEMSADKSKLLPEIITVYLTGIEELHIGMHCSMLQKKGNRLYNIASPGLPKDYLEAIEGQEIGKNAGSCGTAAFVKQKVIVTDIQNDIRWANYREVAERNGLKACWSTPILNRTGNVLATFACYYEETRAPGTLEENTMQRAAHILLIILENINAEQELLISNERLKYVTKATSEIIWDWDLETNEFYYSVNIDKFFGYGNDGTNNGERFLLQHVHPDDRARAVLDASQVKNSTIVNWAEEYRIQKADGEYATVLDKGVVVRNEKGVGIRMVGTMQDVTQLKKEEYHLKLLESVITNTANAVLILKAKQGDKDGEGPYIEFVNEAFIKMTGYATGEVIGKTPYILLGPKSDKNEHQKLSACFREQQACEITSIAYKKNGDEFWLNFKAKPVADSNGVYTHWIAIQQDVTAHKNEVFQIALLSDISVLFNDYPDLNEALTKVLERLVDFGNFSIAEAWLIGSDKNKLSLRAKFYKGSEMKVFYEESGQLTSLTRSEGLPGAVFDGQKVVYWSDLQKETRFIRRGAAKKAGLKSAYGIPLKYNNELIGALVIGLNRVEEIQNSFITFFESFNSHFGAEIRRKQLEQELNQIFNYTPDIICVAGFDGFYKKANPAMSALTEYSETELLQKPYMEFIHPEDKEFTLSEISAIKNGHGAFHFENRFITKSGKIKSLSWTVSAYADDDLFIGMARDISYKKELEDLLNKANESARIGNWEINPGAKTVYWSDITREIYEAGPLFIPDYETFVKSFKKGKNRKLAIRKINEAIEKNIPFDINVQIVTVKDNAKWVRVIGEGEFNGGKCIRVYGSFQDINDIEKASASFKESEKRYSELFHSSPQPMLVFDFKSLKFISANTAAIKYYGYSRKQFLAMDLREISTSEELQKIDDMIKLDKPNGKLSYVGVFSHKKKNGEVLQVDVHSNVIHYDGKRAILALVNDITERMNYIRAIEFQNEKLKEISWMQSHLVRAPLARIMGLVQLIKMSGRDDEEKAQILDYLLTSSNELDEVIKNITDKSRIVGY